jgi:NADPH:quinone reductase-like Zn-dependent oxidoreductase
MKAMVYKEYGSPDVLDLREVNTPTPKDDQVLVKIHAVSINDWDLGLLQGDSLINRALSGCFRPKKTILGSDIAGRIEALGKNVKRLHLGDDVFGDLSGSWGGFAEYVCAPEAALTLKPSSMTFAEAASLPQAGMLALQGLRDKRELLPGQRLLINGAGGGVGTFAVQIAKLHGVEVTAVDSAAKLDLLRSMGCDKVIDYLKEDFTRNGECYDFILDVKTNRSPFDYARALSPGGIYVTVGGSLARLFPCVLLGPLISMAFNKAICVVALKANRDLAYLSELFVAGKIRPVLDTPRTLSELPDAMRQFEAGTHKGKVVILLE